MPVAQYCLYGPRFFMEHTCFIRIALTSIYRASNSRVYYIVGKTTFFGLLLALNLMFRSVENMSRLTLLALLIACALLGGCRSKSPEERLQKAEQLLQQRDTLGAQLEAKAVIKDAPNDPRAVDAHLILAQVYAAEQRADDALAELQIVLSKTSQRDRRGVSALSAYLNILKQEKRYDEALKTIDEYQKQNAADSWTSLSLSVARAETMTRAGQTTGARALLRTLNEGTTAPKDRQLYREMIATTYIADNDVTSALSFFEAELKDTTIPAERRSILTSLVLGSAHTDNYDAARARLDELTRLYQQAIDEELDGTARVRLAQELAEIYFRVGNLPGARAVYQKLLDTSKTPEVVGQLIEPFFSVLMREGSTTDAVKLLRKGAEFFPQSQLSVQAQQLEDRANKNQFAPTDTSTLVLRFRADALLAPTNLKVLDSATTGSTDTAEGATSASVAAKPAEPVSKPAEPAPAQETSAPSSSTKPAESATPAPAVAAKPTEPITKPAEPVTTAAVQETSATR